MKELLTTMMTFALTPNIKNDTLRRIAEKLLELRGDIIAIASVIAGVSFLITLIFNFILPGGDSKEGWKRVKTILIAYACVVGVTLIFGFVDGLLA